MKKRKLTEPNAYDTIDGKKFKFECKCPNKSLDCVTVSMWDALSRQLYKKKSNVR